MKVRAASTFLRKKSIRFLLFICLFAFVFSLVIYLREDSVRHQISYFHVLIWQFVIWIPWAIIFPIMAWARKKLMVFQLGRIGYFGLGLLWISLHFIWFFIVSVNFSPYLGMPASGYGVYPYFFIFWTFIDTVLMGYIILIQSSPSPVKESPPKLIFELSRGGNTFFCEPQQIHWLSAENYYTYLYTEHGRFIMRKPLKYYYDKLSELGFIQIHRSTVVQIDYVSGLLKGRNNGLEVLLKDGTRRKVSRNTVKQVKELFQERLT